MAIEKPLPQNEQAEHELIAMVLGDFPGAVEDSAFLPAEDFYREAYQEVWKAKESARAKGPVNLTTMYDELMAMEAIGPGRTFESFSELTCLVKHVSSLASAKANANIIREKAIARRFIESLGDVAGAAYSGDNAAALALTTHHRDELERELIAGGKDSPLRPLTLAEMRKKPKPIPLIDHFLVAKTISMVVGLPGGGKTCMLVDQACHVALSRPWMGRAVNGGTVVYIAAEGGAGLTGRFDAWISVNNDGEDIPNLYILPYAVPFLDEKQRAQVLAYLRALPESPAWVIVDTVSQTSAGADENSNSEMATYLNAVAQIRDTLGAHVTLVHHTDKNGNGSRGASSLDGFVDISIMVSRDEKDVSTITCKKPPRDGWGKFAPIYFTADQIAPDGYDGLTFGVLRSLVSATQKHASATGPDKQSSATVDSDYVDLPDDLYGCLRVLFEAGKPLGYREWEKKAATKLQDRRRKLLASGLIEQDESDDYRLTTKGYRALQSKAGERYQVLPGSILALPGSAPATAATDATRFFRTGSVGSTGGSGAAMVGTAVKPDALRLVDADVEE